MKISKKLLAGAVLALAFGLAGCGGGGGGPAGGSNGGTAPKKEEMKAPAAVTVKAGNVEMTVQKLLGYSVKDKSVFLAEGIAYYKGDLIVVNNTEGKMTAYKLSKDKVEIDKGLFKDGEYAGEKGDSIKYPVAAGDGCLYFQHSGLKSADGKNVKEALKYGYMWIAPGSTAEKAYIYGDNGAYGTGKLVDGVVTDFQAGPFNNVESLGAVVDNGYPMKQYSAIVAEGDTLYIAGRAREKKGDTAYAVVAMSAGGELIRRYGSEKKEDPSFMFMIEHLTVLPKYLVVAVSNGSFHIFDKADGKFLGKVKNEEMFGNEMEIEGMAKINDDTFAIQYRTSVTKEEEKYEYSLATITMK